MEREELLKKLKTIKPTIAELVYTYDMGLQFTFMDSTGMSVNIGNFGDIPLWKFKRLTNEELNKIETSIKNNVFTKEELPEALKIFAEDISKRYEDIDLSNIFLRLVDFPILNNNEFFYILCDTKSWHFEIQYFNTEEEIKSEFFKQLSIDSNWDDLSDEELQNCYAVIEEEGEGIPVRDTTKPAD